MERTCSVDGCERKHKARGYCELHFKRWKKHGDPHIVLAPAAPAKGRGRVAPLTRFMMKVDHAANGCWEWTGALSQGGYGQFRAESTQPVVYAHRWSYTHHVGNVPPGLHLDHLCRNRRCVNPEHLEPVTPLENVRRSDRSNVRGRPPGTACGKGHPFSPANTYVDPTGTRVCRTCKRAREAARRARQRASLT